MTRTRLSRLGSVLFWLVISAAFIGPGTVTTAASAGAGYGYALIWALLFSTLACIVLQEAAARLPLASGHNLGQAIARKYGRYSKEAMLAAGTIMLGGVAYQAGNLMGASSGAALLLDWDSRLITALLALSAGLLLWFGSYRLVAQVLGLVVALMGCVFVAVVVRLDIDWLEAMKASVVPEIPALSGWRVIGLIGTTIVPYNLFLGSGISKGQEIGNMRWGLAIAILIGGLISMAILLVGSTVIGPFSFEALSKAMSEQLGGWASRLFGVGLLAAGFSSAITAPLAAGITVESIFGSGEKGDATGSRMGRWAWIIVLVAGFGFGVLGAKPIPAIIAAQAFNGILLPMVSIFLLLMVNDSRIMPRDQLNPSFSNILMLLVVGITTMLGVGGVIKAGYKALGIDFPADGSLIPYLIGLGILVLVLVGRKVGRLRYYLEDQE